MFLAANNLDLRKRRKRLGISLDELGAELEVDISGISRFERGFRVDLPHGKGRADYEAALSRIEGRRQGAA